MLECSHIGELAKSLTKLVILVVSHIVSTYAFNFCIHNNLDYHL